MAIPNTRHRNPNHATKNPPLSIQQQEVVQAEANALAFEASRRTKDQLFTQQSALVQTDYSCYHTVMSTLPLDIRRQAKEPIETGKTFAEFGALLDIKPGTILESKRLYMWDGPEGLNRSATENQSIDGSSPLNSSDIQEER